MTNLTRRSLIKAGIAASASMFGPGTVLFEPSAAKGAVGAQSGNRVRDLAPGELLSPRHRLQLDFGWSFHLEIGPSSSLTLEHAMPLAQAKLWSIDTPNMYSAVTQIESDGAIVDHDAATFGIRSIRVDPDKGFFLIGEHVKIMGTCNHQGHAGVGIAVPDAIHVERVAALIFVNGVSAGVKSPRRNCPMYWRVIHAPSAIEARGMRQGKVVLVARRETSGTAAQPALLPSKAALRGNGEDVVSRRGGGARRTGTHRPTAFNTIHSSLSAPGKIIGVGNGDPASHEADRPASPTSAERSAFSEQCIVFVQAAKQAGIIELRASGAGLTPTVVKIVSTAETPRPAAA